MIDIQDALNNSKFILYFQPKMNLSTNRVDSAEALIRIIEGGRLIPPSEFIPRAEKTGEIIDISEWVFKRVVSDSRYIHLKSESDISISINVSATHFKHEDLVKNLKRIFDFTKDFESHFIIELTESAMIDDIKLATKKMQELKTLGFDLSLDDFGTGYSSLISLKDFPIDEIKIDKCFIDEIVQNKRTFHIAESIISLSKKLNIITTAEGVEDIEQVNLLRQIGCDRIQGYYYSKPLSVEKFILYTRVTNKTNFTTKFITWNEKYKIGNYAIDTQHMILANMLNKMYIILQDKNKREQTDINIFVEILDDFTVNHFKAEEKYMLKHNYPFIEDHIKRHEEIRLIINDFKNNITQSNERNLFNLFKIIKELFLKHELNIDKKMVNYIEKNR